MDDQIPVITDWDTDKIIELLTDIVHELTKRLTTIKIDTTCLIKNSETPGAANSE